ncbi:MAG: hypothetical protein QXO94_04820 [Candidatus Bathyarchaeia archaeon]
MGFLEGKKLVFEDLSLRCLRHYNFTFIISVTLRITLCLLREPVNP